MHELNPTRSLLHIALEKGAAAGAKRISKIALVVGKLSAVAPHSIEFCFGALAHGTLAESATLVFDEPAAQARCQGCGAEFFLECPYDPCPQCGATTLDIHGGDEFYLKSIEIEA